MSTPWRMRTPDVEVVKKGNGMKMLIDGAEFSRCGIALLSQFTVTQESVADG